MSYPGSHFRPTLTLETVIPYLVRRGYLTIAELVQDGATVHDATRRNCNFLIERPAGHGLLLKQARDERAALTVASEARIYSAIQYFWPSHPLRRNTAPFLEYDTKEGILFLRSVPHAGSLAASHNRGRFPTRPLAPIARTLAALHTLDIGSAPFADIRDLLPRLPPHAFLMHRPDYALYCNASRASLQALQFVQSFSGFVELIDTLGEDWRSDHLIHSDVKGDNILVCPQRSIGNAKLIDWEMCALGDPAWDVGSMFADCLGVWLASIPIIRHCPPEQYLPLAQLPLSRLRPGIRVFWQSYRMARRFTDVAAARFLLRATRYAAARLIQRTYEQTQEAAELSANHICQLQVSWNVLKAPEMACIQLLGLDFNPKADS